MILLFYSVLFHCSVLSWSFILCYVVFIFIFKFILLCMFMSYFMASPGLELEV